MDPKDVTTAAQLIEQLSKIDTLLDFAAEAAGSAKDGLTLTFRKGTRSKSLTIHEPETVAEMHKMVIDIRNDTVARLVALGVEMNK